MTSNSKNKELTDLIEYNEGMVPEIVYDYNLKYAFGYKNSITDYNPIRCKHCHSPSEVVSDYTTRRGKWVEKYVIVPRVIRAFNEGGYNSIVICVDCLKEVLANE